MKSFSDVSVINFEQVNVNWALLINFDPLMIYWQVTKNAREKKLVALTDTMNLTAEKAAQ